MDGTTRYTPNDEEQSHDFLTRRLSEAGMNASAHGSAEEENRTVVVQRDENELPAVVESFAEEEGFFVFATDAEEVTLSAYADCEWKSSPDA